ncbi:MAG: DNRLRE domain-containing protein, partial [Phycisphaerales bacterium]|nr:DNRLRE domain-containing protein [Phycisphaerales bacterium]
MSFFSRSAAASVAAMAVLGVHQASSDVVEIVSSKDNTLYQQASGNLSNGSGSYMFAGRVNADDDQSIRRALLAFDVHQFVPTGATINNVTLELSMSRTRTGAIDIGLHTVLAPWGEGTSNAIGEEGGGTASTPGDATWLHTFYPTTFWAAPGGDFDPLALATTSVNREGPYTWTSSAMASEVQAWLDDPSTNDGWILTGEETNERSTKRFDAREHPVPSQRPRLIVDFTPPANAGACCIPDGSCLVLTEVQCDQVGGTFQGIGVSC